MKIVCANAKSQYRQAAKNQQECENTRFYKGCVIIARFESRCAVHAKIQFHVSGGRRGINELSE